MADAAFKATILDNQKLAEERGASWDTCYYLRLNYFCYRGDFASCYARYNFLKGTAGHKNSE